MALGKYCQIILKTLKNSKLKGYEECSKSGIVVFKIYSLCNLTNFRYFVENYIILLMLLWSEKITEKYFLTRKWFNNLPMGNY